MWEDHDLVKLITQRNSKLGELLRGEDILKAMRHDLPETVKSKRNPIKGKLVQILSNATRSI